MKLTTFDELAQKKISNGALQGTVIYDDMDGMEYIIISSFDDSQIMGLLLTSNGMWQTTQPYDNLADFIVDEILAQDDEYFPTKDELSKIHLYAPLVANATLNCHMPDDLSCEISDGTFVVTME
ncbi:MAG: hypothetical protein [Bacteriophage sp.]|nr:MAG: hypothetical protein [Bacteriophage sp.]